MKRLRRSAPLLVAALLLGLAAVFALLAVDVRAWQGTLRRDDVRFRRVPTPSQGLWRSPATLPGDPAYRCSASATRSRTGARCRTSGSATSASSQRQRPWTSPQTRVEDRERAPDAVPTAQRPPPSAPVAANLLGVMTITTPDRRQRDAGAELDRGGRVLPAGRRGRIRRTTPRRSTSSCCCGSKRPAQDASSAGRPRRVRLRRLARRGRPSAEGSDARSGISFLTPLAGAVRAHRRDPARGTRRDASGEHAACAGSSRSPHRGGASS